MQNIVQISLMLVISTSGMCQTMKTNNQYIIKKNCLEWYVYKKLLKTARPDWKANSKTSNAKVNKNVDIGRTNRINRYTPEGTREFYLRVDDLQSTTTLVEAWILQIMDTRMGFPFLTLETGISANFDVRRNVVPPWRVRQAHSGSYSPMTPQNVNAKQSRKVASSVRFRHILHIFRQEREE